MMLPFGYGQSCWLPSLVTMTVGMARSLVGRGTGEAEKHVIELKLLSAEPASAALELLRDLMRGLLSIERPGETGR